MTTVECNEKKGYLYIYNMLFYGLYLQMIEFTVNLSCTILQ